MTAPHYGKRYGGNLAQQAAGSQSGNEGDTLFFQFAAYNDSGDSEAVSGFAVTDIEVFKNGDPITRATDSGYSLISDTGQIGDRVGLNRFSVQLFNTTDDTGHYEVGAWYQVAVDSVTIDGKTVRMWAGSFEIGTPRANVVQIDGDTGPADNLGRIAADTGTGSYLYRERDTGGIADAIWAKDVRALTAFQFDTGVWGSNFASGRTLTQLGALDTGLRDVVADAVWDEKDTGHSDTGTFGRLRQGVNINKVDGDTGPADNMGRAFGDTGTGAAEAVWFADTLLDRNMATGADNEAFNNRTPRGALSVLRNRVEFDTGSVIVYKEDDSTPRWSGTTESDTGSDGVKTIDPASA